VEAAVGLAGVAGARHGHAVGLAKDLPGEGGDSGDDDGEADHFEGLGFLFLVFLVGNLKGECD